MNTIAPLSHPASDQAADLPSDLKGACKALEEEFAQVLLSAMRTATLGGESKGSLGFSKDVAYSMFDAGVAKMCAEGEGLGLWRMMMEQLSPGSGQDDGSKGVKSEKAAAEKKGGGIVGEKLHVLG